MELILDTADTQAIAYFNEHLTISGVTTNPTIITSNGKDFTKVINEILAILDDKQDLYVQVISTSYEAIIEEALYIASLRKGNPEHIYVKIPVTNEGLKAIKAVKKLGIKVLATAIYSAEQGFLAALSQADAIAPYVNRMCNFSDGVQTTIQLQRMLDAHGMDTKIVAASFKNTSQVHQLIENGIKAVTVPTDVLKNMMNHPATTIAVDEFTMNWQKAYGRNTLI